MHNVDTVRLFQQTYASRKQDDPLGKVKCVNTSNMPPYQSVLTKKILRASYNASLYKMLYDQIQLPYVGKQTSMVGSLLMEGT